ncbi:hypothetical protein COOONC_04609 [Cooperia oncophora]
MPLHFYRTSRRLKNVTYIRQQLRRTLSVNQSLIRQKFRFTDDQLDWITELLGPLSWMHYCILTSSSSLLNFNPRMSSDAKRDRMSSRGQERCPENVIGAVDGTLVRIRTPAVDGRCRSNPVRQNSGSPGSVHDATCSSVTPLLQQCSTEVIAFLAIRRYANGSGIITPFRPTAIRGDARKTRYNREHCRMRAIVEMTIGRLKSRFPILSSELRVGPQQASKIVLACAVLHNISLCLNACGIRQLGRRKATMVHPRDDVEDVRAYIGERL